MTTEKFTMNERNNELKISLNKKEVILETKDSKFEMGFVKMLSDIKLHIPYFYYSGKGCDIKMSYFCKDP